MDTNGMAEGLEITLDEDDFRELLEHGVVTNDLYIIQVPEKDWLPVVTEFDDA